MKSKSIIELVNKIENLIPSNGEDIKDELKANIKMLIEDYLHKLKLLEYTFLESFLNGAKML